MNLFQIQTKFRDEIRPRYGLMRGREFIMKDAYSFDVDDAAADKSYWAMFNAYTRIFARLGVKFRHVEADSGAIGGSFTHEFHVLAGSGEDAILSCDACDYCSNVEKTEAPADPRRRPRPGHARSSPPTSRPRGSWAWKSRPRLQGRRARRHAAAPDLQGLLDGRRYRHRQGRRRSHHPPAGGGGGPARRPRDEPGEGQERPGRGGPAAHGRRRGLHRRR